ncbi:MAG: hypothetical protein EXR49_01960 [Dehalococcoidia bacterium]|nr:hypothetical protein [Dehalococcoidia bacterium]
MTLDAGAGEHQPVKGPRVRKGLGLLFAGEQSAHESLAAVLRALPTLEQAYAHRMISGGVCGQRRR